MDALFVHHSYIRRTTNGGAHSTAIPVPRFSLRSSLIGIKLLHLHSKKFPYPRLRRIPCAAEGAGHHHGHHHHHHHHGCQHHCDGDGVEPTGAQKAFIRFAKAIRWTELANYLREHLQLCCGSAALFLTAAACPYLVPKPAVKPLQNVLVAVAFPLVGVRIVHQTADSLKHG